MFQRAQGGILLAVHPGQRGVCQSRLALRKEALNHEHGECKFFKLLSLVQNRQRCIQDTTKFEDGITNGFDWFVLSRVNIMSPLYTRFSVEGGMQDFNYAFTNCMELTVELSCNKKPPVGRLQVNWIDSKKTKKNPLVSDWVSQSFGPMSILLIAVSFQALWEANMEPLIAFLEEAGKAQRGIVLDQVAQILVGETISGWPTCCRGSRCGRGQGQRLIDEFEGGVVADPGPGHLQGVGS